MEQELARKIKAARAKVKETQEQFAQRLGVAMGTLRNWEQGVREPRGLAHKALLAELDAIMKEEA